MILLSDFYRPFRVALLHEQLYRGQYYNPLSSPNRVHQAIRLLRQWLFEKKIPLTIVHNEEAYSLSASEPIRLIVPPRLWESLHASPNLAWLKLLPEGDFTTGHASRVLSLSPRSARRILQTAVEKGDVLRSGAGKCTQYRVRQK